MRQKAQTAIELAVFGAILIFVLGVIIRTAVVRGNEQQTQLRATRMALSLSYTVSDPPQNQIASHNSASILVIEDRLTAASAKYGAIDRTPFMVQASGSHSANLFMPVDFGDSGDLPVMDVYVNGKRFSFSTVAFQTYPMPPSGKLYTIIDNHPLIPEWCDDSGSPTQTICPPACSVAPGPGCNLSADERFDLDRDGTTDVPVSERERFAWQWYLVLPSEIDVDARKNTSLDVDDDLKLEQVEVVNGGNFGVRDFQKGDIDTTFNDSDTGWTPGFTRDARVYTFVKDDTSSEGGTYLQIDEGKLYATRVGDTRQYIRTASKKDTIDVIERVFQLSNDTGNFCDANDSGRGPVEVCTRSAGGCYTSSNISKTCMDRTSLLIFIRSRIVDFRGRKWVTMTEEDPYIRFNR